MTTKANCVWLEERNRYHKNTHVPKTGLTMQLGWQLSLSTCCIATSLTQHHPFSSVTLLKTPTSALELKK